MCLKVQLPCSPCIKKGEQQHQGRQADKSDKREEATHCGRIGSEAILGVRTSICVQPFSCTNLSWLTHSSSLLSTAVQHPVSTCVKGSTDYERAPPMPSLQDISSNLPYTHGKVVRLTVHVVHIVGDTPLRCHFALNDLCWTCTVGKMPSKA